MQQLLTGQTRLPGFHGEWLPRKLGDILIEQAKTRRQAGSGKESGIYPFFTNDTQGGREFLDEYDFDADAIIANTGGTAFFRHYSGRFAASMHCLVLKSTVDTKWIQYWLKLQEPIINDRCFQGSGLKVLNKKTLRDFDVLLPPLAEEQEAIADILTDIDAELRALESRREKTRALKQGMMQELLTGRIRLLPTEAHHA